MDTKDNHLGNSPAGGGQGTLERGCGETPGGLWRGACGVTPGGPRRGAARKPPGDPGEGAAG